MTKKIETTADFIAKFEGFSEKSYKCPAGVWTIGYGTTCYPNGAPVRPNQTISETAAKRLLEQYLEEEIYPKLTGLGLKGHGQITAIASLVYNIGWSAFARSKCCAALKAKDYPTFIKEYDWFKGGGKVLPGLLKRRTAELAMFFN
jgi:lysozyme